METAATTNEGVAMTATTTRWTSEAGSSLALIDALKAQMLTEDDLNEGELNLIHAIFAEEVADGSTLANAAELAVEQMLEG